MFMHYKWVKIEIANRRFLATRTFFQIWKSWPRYLGNGAQVLDFTLKKSEVQHPLDFTFFTVGLHFKFLKKNIGLHRRKCTICDILFSVEKYPTAFNEVHAGGKLQQSELQS